MSKYIYIAAILVFSAGLSVSLSGCAPYINAANRKMVTIYVPSTNYESDALAMADKHCEQYGLAAILRKPRVSSKMGELYDYNCVK